MAAVVRKIINTAKGPKAVGPYNQAVVVDKTVYVSGMIGLDPVTGDLVPGGVVPQTEMALKNMGEVLKAAGSSFSNVVKTTVLLADIKDYAAVNQIYTNFFTTNYPARAAYQAGALPKAALVEIEAVGIVGTIIDE